MCTKYYFFVGGRHDTGLMKDYGVSVKRIDRAYPSMLKPIRFKMCDCLNPKKQGGAV
jgi:hypothetical protein